MRILVATDGSDPSAIGVEQARDLATLSHGTLRIVAVLPPTSDLFGGSWPAEAMIDPEPLERAACQRLEERLRQELVRTPSDLRPTSVLRRGRPAEEIVAEATDWSADLIVVGSRGHGPLSSILLGSVSEEVVDRSTIPVLIARRPVIRRLVVAVDGSPAADAAVAFLGRDRAFVGLDAAVISVVPGAYPWWLGLATADSDSLEVVLRTNEVARRDQQTAAELAIAVLSAAGVEATSRLRTGDPAEQIVQAAADIDADLIVIGSRGLAGFTRLVLGSVARQVVRHAGVSVLVVHAPTPATTDAADTRDGDSHADEPAAPRPVGPAGAAHVHKPTKRGHAASSEKEPKMKILLAYDGGAPAQRALTTAAGIATAMGGSVDVISVVPMHPGRAPIDPWDDREVHDRELREAHQRLADLGITTRLLEPAGDPAHEIEAAAETGGYDMVVLGSRRQNALNRMLQGSVSEHVATHADTTVVIAH